MGSQRVRHDWVNWTELATVKNHLNTRHKIRIQGLLNVLTELLSFLLSVVRYDYLSIRLVQFSSVAQSCPSLCNPMDCSMPGIPVHHQPGACLNSYPSSRWCHSTISSSVVPFSCFQSFPALGPFRMSQFFSSGGQSIGASAFSISPSNEYSGLISFRIDWFDLFAVQETLKTLLKHHSSKASILRRSAFFIVQVSHPYMITRKTIPLTIWIFVSKMMSLPFNKLSSFIRASLPRSKHFFFYFMSYIGQIYLKKI